MGVTYRARRDQVTGQVALFAHQHETLPFNAAPDIPVALLTAGLTVGDEAGALPVLAIAENIADLLNHKTPQHSVTLGTGALFYSRTDHAITLRRREADPVSHPAVIMTVSSKSSVADLGQQLLTRMDNGFMKKLCDTCALSTRAVPAQKGPSCGPLS